MSNVFSSINFSRDKCESDIYQKQREIDLLLDHKTLKFFNFHDLSDANFFKDKLTYLLHEMKLKPKIKFTVKQKHNNNNILIKNKESIPSYKNTNLRNNVINTPLSNLKKSVLKNGTSLNFKKNSLSLKKLIRINKEEHKLKECRRDSNKVKSDISIENETTENYNNLKTFLTTQNEYFATENESNNVASRNTNYRNTKISDNNCSSSEGILNINKNNLFTSFTPDISISKLSKSNDRKIKLKAKYEKFITEIKTFQPSKQYENSDDKDISYINKYLMNGDKHKKTSTRPVSYPERKTELIKESSGKFLRQNRISKNINDFCNINIKNCQYFIGETKSSVYKLNEKVKESFKFIMNTDDLEKKILNENTKIFLSESTNNKQLLLSNNLVKKAKSSITNSKIK